MDAKNSSGCQTVVTDDSVRANEKDFLVRDRRSCCAKRPGLVTALVLHYVKCSGVSLENFQANDSFA